MFELVSEDTIRYKGDGTEQWKEEYVANIRKKAEAITVENMLEWNSTYYLKQAKMCIRDRHSLLQTSRIWNLLMM